MYLYATAKVEIQICSNKHETGLVRVRTDCVPAWYFVFHSLKLDMQYDDFQRKKSFDLLNPSGVESVCKERLFALMLLYAPHRLIGSAALTFLES